ncbi:MAG: D-alanyl-D-alanine carboxypeptidase family protein [Porcipelethomonas sp.]
MCIFCLCTNAGAVTFEPDFDVYGQSVVLMNLDTESVIYEKNPDMEQMPASLVNIMTAIIVLENCADPDTETIRADKTLYNEFEEYEYQDDLRYGEIWDGDTLTVTDYLYALMLTSSCEAANILAYHFGNGNISAFVEKMNEKASEIGAENTYFANPHGLYDPKQITTANDMIKITLYALSVPGFEEIATAEEYEVHPQSYVTPHEETWIWSHSNIIMSAASDYYMYGVKGVKTGNLVLSGRNIITMGSSDGINYLLVDLNAPFYDSEGDSKYYHIIDAYNLLEWAFNSFEFKVILDDTEEIAEVKVENSDGNGYVLVKPAKEYKALWYDEIDVTSIQRNINVAKSVQAPVKKGQKLGEYELRLSDETIASVDLIAASDVDRSFVKFNMTAAKNFFKSKWLARAFLIAILISAAYLGICIWAFVYAKKNPKGGFSNKKIVKRLYKSKHR